MSQLFLNNCRKNLMETVLKSLELSNDENPVFIPFAPSFIDRYGPATNNTSECWYGVKWCKLHFRLQFDLLCGDKWKFCRFFQKVLNQKNQNNSVERPPLSEIFAIRTGDLFVALDFSVSKTKWNGKIFQKQGGSFYWILLMRFRCC